MAFPEPYCVHALPLDPSRQNLTPARTRCVQLKSVHPRVGPEGGGLTLRSPDGGQCAFIDFERPEYFKDAEGAIYGLILLLILTISTFFSFKDVVRL